MSNKKEILIDFLDKSNKVTSFDGIPEVRSLIDAIRADQTGGEYFRVNLRSLAAGMGIIWKTIFQESLERNGPPVIIAIPRGGVPMGEGLKNVFLHSRYYLTNDGQEKIPGALLPLDFSDGDVGHLLIADTVIGTGETIRKTIGAVEQSTNVSFIHVFSAVASAYGIDRLLQEYPLGLQIWTGCVEKDYEWVNKDGKQVLFVAGIGDAGELVSK